MHRISMPTWQTFLAAAFMVISRASAQNYPPAIGNVIAAQRVDASRLMDIIYRLADAEGDAGTVRGAVTDDCGAPRVYWKAAARAPRTAWPPNGSGVCPVCGIDAMVVSYAFWLFLALHPTRSTDGPQPVGRSGVPGFAAGVQQIVVVGVHPIAELLRLEPSPQALNWIQFGRVRRQVQ